MDALKTIKNLKVAITLFVIALLIEAGLLLLLGLGIHQAYWHVDLTMLIYLFLPSIVLSILMIVLIIFAVRKTLYIYSKYPRKYRLTLIAVFIAPLLSFVSYRLVDHARYVKTYTFTVEKWEAADDNGRGMLIDSFRELHPLVNENIELAESLLGTPDIKQGPNLYYFIGDYKHWIAIDPYYYLIEFDVNGVILSEDIYQG